MKKFFEDFKAFALKGNMIDLAVGMIIGAAFNSIVQSLVNDIVMPLISLCTGKIDFSNLFISLNGEQYATLAAAQEAGAATLNYGTFISNVINFLIEAFVIFVIVRWISNLKRKEEPVVAAEPVTKTCPYCQSEISIKAVKCPNCTSDL